MDETQRTKQWQIGDEIVGGERVVQCPDCVPGTGYICKLHKGQTSPREQAYIMWKLSEEQFEKIVSLLQSIDGSLEFLVMKARTGR